MYKPYSVFAPPYDVTSGGIRVMYGLRSWLETKGQIVFMNAKFENQDFIAIYPEITHGNPLEATKVVRYILNKPGVMASYGVPGPTEFSITDEKYIFSRIFDDKDEYDDDHVMFLPILNLHLFKDQQKKRDKTAYFIGKGINFNNHPEGAIYLNKEIVQDQQRLADTLNECHTLYGYDPVSAMYEVSRLCGCKVNLYQTAIPKERWEKYEPGMNGINSELDTAAFRKHYISMIMKFDRQIDKFIESTQICLRR